MRKKPDGDLEHFQFLSARVHPDPATEGVAADELAGRHGACTLRLPELQEATEAEVADLGARIQRVVDEWSSARAGKSVYEHTGRKYEKR